MRIRDRRSPFSKLPTPLKWRSETHQHNLAIQTASLLLQKPDPFPLLKSALPSPLPSSLFYRILTRIKSQPETALSFFNFSTSNLQFKPDVTSALNLTLTLIQSPEFLDESKEIIEPVLRAEPVRIVLDSAVRAASRRGDSERRLLSFLLENYASLRLIPSSLQALERFRVLGLVPETGSCNELLDALCRADRFDHALVCYGVLVRIGFERDGRSWDVICRVLCGNGGAKGAEKLLGLGVCGVSSYDLVIDCHCERGELGDALQVLEQMRKRSSDFAPGFVTYASLLDGGCKWGSSVVVGLMLKEMVARGLMPTAPFLDYGLVIGRLCGLKKTFAAEMLFERARDAGAKLEEGVYANLLTALAMDGRIEEATGVYKIVSQEDAAMMTRASCEAFLSGICKGEPSEEADSVLKVLIAKGFLPGADDLSMYVGARCGGGNWNEASDILNLVLEEGVQLDAFCCCSLVEHYCANGLVSSATAVHEKLKKSGGCLDVISYNTLLEALLLETRTEEAMRVFEYMREKGVLSSDSYVIVIGSLCREKEMRKAMNLHDEMLRMKLKPDDATYRNLISGFAEKKVTIL